MKAARKITSISLGMAAGLLGIEHAISEILQAPKETGGWFMHAIGAPCQPQLSWNACLPAITIFPQFLSAGIGTLLASFFLMVVCLLPLGRRLSWLHWVSGGLLFLAGGGFVAFFQSLLAALTRNAAWPPGRIPMIRRVLARVWPLTLIAFLLGMAAGWTAGQVDNDLMAALSGLTFVGIDLCLPLLAVFSALARQDG